MAKMIIGNVTVEGTVEEIKALMAEAGGEEVATAYVKIPKSEAKVGDYVYFEYAPSSYLTDEKYYAIIEIDGAGDPQIIDDEGDMFDTYEENFVVYRKVEAEEQEEPTLKKAGNYVKFDENLDGITAGKYYELQVDSDSDLFFRDDDGDTRFRVLADDRFGAEYFAEKEEQPALKVGDYAKVVEHNNTIHFGGKTGDIVKVVKILSDRVQTEELDGGDYDGDPYVQPEGIVPATDEEVAKAKAQADRQAVEAKWAKIGRKVGEFKKGDIVRVTGGGSMVPIGAIGEITEIDTDSAPYRVNTADITIGNWQSAGTIELITPVEARFDREAAE